MKEATNGTCIQLNNHDVLRAISWLAAPPLVSCKKMTTVQGIAVCEDDLPKDCIIWSEISSNWCDHYGSLDFEIYWSKRGCQVTLFHYVQAFKNNICSIPEGKMVEYPNINIVRGSMWQGMCYNCFYNLAKKHMSNFNRIDILKIQGREGVNEDFDGVQYSVMSGLFWQLPQLISRVSQVVMTVSLNTRTLSDQVGRESEHAWNMWATQRLLKDFGAFSIHRDAGPKALQPQQFSYLLHQARLDANYGTYRQSFVRLRDPALLAKQNALFEAWKPAPVPFVLRGTPPSYCADRTPAAGQWLQQCMCIVLLTIHRC